MRVRDWMTSPAVTLTSDTRVVDALELMAVRKIRRVPVLEEGRLVGILAVSDLRDVAGRDESSPRRGATLGDLMKRGVVTVRPDDRLDLAARLMVEHEISGLPVVEAGVVVGLITESDIFAAFTHLLEAALPPSRSGALPLHSPGR